MISAADDGVKWIRGQSSKVFRNASTNNDSTSSITLFLWGRFGFGFVPEGSAPAFSLLP